MVGPGRMSQNVATDAPIIEISAPITDARTFLMPEDTFRAMAAGMMVGAPISKVPTSFMPIPTMTAKITSRSRS